MLHLGPRQGTTPDTQRPATSHAPGRRLTLGVVGAAATAVVVGFVATAAQPQDGAPAEITVVVTDAASAGGRPAPSTTTPAPSSTASRSS